MVSEAELASCGMNATFQSLLQSFVREHAQGDGNETASDDLDFLVSCSACL